MNAMTFRGYTARVEYDERDDILVGRVLGLRSTMSFHGKTVAELRREFTAAIKVSCRLRRAGCFAREAGLGQVAPSRAARRAQSRTDKGPGNGQEPESAGYRSTRAGGAGRGLTAASSGQSSGYACFLPPILSLESRRSASAARPGLHAPKMCGGARGCTESIRMARVGHVGPGIQRRLLLRTLRVGAACSGCRFVRNLYALPARGKGCRRDDESDGRVAGEWFVLAFVLRRR